MKIKKNKISAYGRVNIGAGVQIKFKSGRFIADATACNQTRMSLPFPLNYHCNVLAEFRYEIPDSTR